METPQNIPSFGPQKITGFFKKNLYEVAAWQANEYIVGVDEVGRGCTAGPVVAAAVILHFKAKHPLLKDSKLLNPQELATASAWIKKNAWWATGTISSDLIDTHNIYQATKLAMARALAQLEAIAPVAASKILIDAMPLRHKSFNSAQTLYFVKGEQRSSSVAAASIIAKVYRDHVMEQISSSLPYYGLAQHKGYSTTLHQQAIAAHGTTVIHRLTFIHTTTDSNEQQSLFC